MGALEWRWEKDDRKKATEKFLVKKKVINFIKS